MTHTLAQNARPSRPDGPGLAARTGAGKYFSLFAVLDRHGKVVQRARVNHESGTIQAFLSQLPPGTPVALETVGNWCWIVDEIEAARRVPHLARAAKTTRGHVHKTDKLDADGLGILLHNGTLPSVWIPPRGDPRRA